MLTKTDYFSSVNAIASDTISSYIKDGYRIDAKESTVDPKNDKHCVFKAVLKKDSNGVMHKSVITLSNTDNDTVRSCTYRKVDTVGDILKSEEIQRFNQYINCNNAGCRRISARKGLDDYIKLNSKEPAKKDNIFRSDNTDIKTPAGKFNTGNTHNEKPKQTDLFSKQDQDDEAEDSLIKLIRYITAC